jgi:Glyoxalase-like domain
MYGRSVGIRIRCLVVDPADCERLARFWSEALGRRIAHQTPDEWAIEPPEGGAEVDVAPDILFVKVPDTKTVKNRLHVDLRPLDQDAQVSRLVGLGAGRFDIGQSDDGVVMADPEGNEFCVLAPLGLAQVSWRSGCEVCR